MTLTGYGADEDRHKSQEAGFDCHLVKSAAPDDLQRLLHPRSGYPGRAGTTVRVTVTDWPASEQGAKRVRLDARTGALWAGGELLGEVPVGSKEHAILTCLAARLDQLVPYADMKHAVLKQTGSTDTTEEATFCQGLKSRIKKKWIPAIDRLIVTTNKGDGYRLRGYLIQRSRGTFR